MSTPAQVTEAHRATAETIFKLAKKAAHNGDPFREPCAQLIADSEATAIDQLRAEVERLKADGAASAFVNMSCRASRAETDRNNLRADLDAIKAILTEEKARADRAEAELAPFKDTSKGIGGYIDSLMHAKLDAEAELAGIRALADRRNERDHSQDTTHQLVAALDQALDIAQAELADLKANNRFQRGHSAGYAEAKADCEAELATERARLDWLEENANDIMKYNCRSYIWFAHQNIRAAIDAEMQEEAK